MFIKQNSSSKFKNIFVIKEQFHNSIVLLFTILFVVLSSFFLYECLKLDAYAGIILVIIFYAFSFTKIITNSLLIIKLKKIKNEIEPSRLNFYIYQSSWMRKKITTFWTTLSYLTIFIFILLIYLIIYLVDPNSIKPFLLIFCTISIFVTILIGLINYKIINHNLAIGRKYISTIVITSYDNILQSNQWNILFKKIYIYLCFSLLIFPWFLMLNLKFKKMVIVWINNEKSFILTN